MSFFLQCTLKLQILHLPQLTSIPHDMQHFSACSWMDLRCLLKTRSCQVRWFLSATKLLPSVLLMRSSFLHHFSPCLSLLRRAGLFSHRTPSLLGVLMGCHWLLLLRDLLPVGWESSYKAPTLRLSCCLLTALAVFPNAEDIFFLHRPSFHVLSKPFLLSVSYWLILGQEETLALLMCLWSSCYWRHWNCIL